MEVFNEDFFERNLHVLITKEGTFLTFQNTLTNSNGTLLYECRNPYMPVSFLYMPDGEHHLSKDSIYYLLMLGVSNV